MKHPFHTLFYIGLTTMIFIGGFVTLILINIKDLLPSSFGVKSEVIVRQDVINTKPYEVLSQPTVEIKPIETVIIKKTPKSTPIPVQKVEVPKVDTTIISKEIPDSSQTHSELSELSFSNPHFSFLVCKMS